MGSTVSPSISVSSSLDGLGEHQGGHTDFVDPDILLDKLGFHDLDANVTKEELQELLRKHISSNNGLPTLNERMSEETMDDVHAFQDLQFVSKASKISAAAAGIEEEDSIGEDDSPEKSVARRNQLSSSAIVGSMSYLLSTLDEDEGEDEGDDDDEGGDVIVEIPKDMVSGDINFGRRKNMEKALSTMAVVHSDSSEDEDDDNKVQVPTSIMDELKISEERRKLIHRDTSDAQVFEDGESEDDEEGDVIFEIPKSIGKSNKKKNRESLLSTTTLENASSIDDDEDDDNAEVAVPTSVLGEMKISEERRKLKREDTTVAQAGSNLDFLEDDEQDGLEADLADEVVEPR